MSARVPHLAVPVAGWRLDNSAGPVMARPARGGRPRGMTKAKIVERDDAIFAIVEEQQPTGIRFVFYRASALHLVPKTEAGYGTVQRSILRMRRDERIPWSWIVDNTRWMRKPTTWDSVDDLLDAQSASYRRSLWTDADTVVEVWCESESLAGVLLPVTREWDVPLYPCHGQTSDSFAWAAAQEYKDDPRDVCIYYYGDHDPHGYEISSQLEKKLIDFSGRDDIEFTGVACTEDNIEYYGLHAAGDKPKKRSYVDARTELHVPWRGPAVQIEAIDPRNLRAELKSYITDHVDPKRLRLLQVQEQSEREQLEYFARLARGEAA